MAPIESLYKWKVKVPQDNTYGLALYSKIEMLDCQERRLVQRDVPSVRALMRLGNGQKFWFYAVHPRPPVRGNLEGDLEFTGAASRDAELIRVALEIGELREPVLVAGDFNDVAWSHTTRRFQRLGRLLDPRVGRGLYNSYHAQHAWFRFPVDHLFHSKEFSLVHFGRGPEIGSDHFPILATPALGAPPEQQPPPRKPDDVQEAVETLNYGFSNR
jgi:endonuclease/exonuclease/phosphatase (EEP) superfamily protein YafD